MNHYFPNMFKPIQIGTVTVPNRFVVPPMGNNFANTDGSMSDRSAAYYEARAKGGFGLITLESTVVYKEAKGGPASPASLTTPSSPVSRPSPTAATPTAPRSASSSSTPAPRATASSPATP